MGKLTVKSIRAAATARKGRVQRVVRRRMRTYYSCHWLTNGYEGNLSGNLTEMVSHAVSAVGRGAQMVMITKCQTERAS